MSDEHGVGTGALFTVIGAGIAALSLYSGTEFLRHERESLSAPGTVVELLKSCDSDGCTYRPVVEYTARGQKQRIEGTVGSKPSSYEVGETVNVLYHAEHPGEARIDTFSENWLFPVIGVLFGTVFGGFGAGVIFRVRRKRQREEHAGARVLGPRRPG